MLKQFNCILSNGSTVFFTKPNIKAREKYNLDQFNNLIWGFELGTGSRINETLSNKRSKFKKEVKRKR